MRKGIVALAITLLAGLGIAACTTTSAETTPVTQAVSTETASAEESAAETDAGTAAAGASEEVPEEAGEDTGDNIMVAYFSKTGNTETVANMIAEQTGADLFKVETVDAYPDDYNETVDIARTEQDNNARPALSTHVENMDQYDVIFVGYPNWWGTMPMAMFTFLEEYDLSGKTIIPFCTHGGSALGSSESDIAALSPNSERLDGLAVSGSRAESAEEDVAAWIEELGIIAN